MRIMLACSLGVSTSLVVKRMKDEAQKQGKDYKIWAVDQTEIEHQLGEFDVLLLGPQVRHIKKKVERIVGDLAPIDVISPVAYGKCDGVAVLKQAEEILGGKNNE